MQENVLLVCFSFRDESDQSFEADVMLLAAGIAIIICYVAIVMGKFNEVEHKVSHVQNTSISCATATSYM